MKTEDILKQFEEIKARRESATQLPFEARRDIERAIVIIESLLNEIEDGDGWQDRMVDWITSGNCPPRERGDYPEHLWLDCRRCQYQGPRLIDQKEYPPGFHLECCPNCNDVVGWGTDLSNEARRNRLINAWKLWLDPKCFDPEEA
jgi:hypothetical protein